MTSLGELALAWSDQALVTIPHRDLTLGLVAGEIGGTAPTLHSAFGSLLGFHARLAARQWQQATAALDQSDRTPLGLAMADIAFAIDNPYRFLLMYDPALWQRSGSPVSDQAPAREVTALQELVAERNENVRRFEYALRGRSDEPRIRLVCSLLTGLSFEFVCERLFQGQRDRQLAHAEEVLRLVIR